MVMIKKQFSDGYLDFDAIIAEIKESRRIEQDKLAKQREESRKLAEKREQERKAKLLVQCPANKYEEQVKEFVKYNPSKPSDPYIEYADGGAYYEFKNRVYEYNKKVNWLKYLSTLSPEHKEIFEKYIDKQK